MHARLAFFLLVCFFFSTLTSPSASSSPVVVSVLERHPFDSVQVEDERAGRLPELIDIGLTGKAAAGGGPCLDEEAAGVGEEADEVAAVVVLFVDEGGGLALSDIEVGFCFEEPSWTCRCCCCFVRREIGLDRGEEGAGGGILFKLAAASDAGADIEAAVAAAEEFEGSAGAVVPLVATSRAVSRGRDGDCAKPFWADVEHDGGGAAADAGAA